MQLQLLEKQKHKDPDVMSFKFSRKTKDRFVKYKPGQFVVLDLHTNNDDKGSTRCFTLSSSPSENYLMVTTKIRDSPFKEKLEDTTEGAKLDVDSLEGEFTLPRDSAQNLVFLSGGIGVTPFRSMIKYATDMDLKNNILMFNSNKSPEKILFKDEFDKCQQLNKNIKIIYTLTENTPEKWNGETGRIDKYLLQKHMSKSTLLSSHYFVCGPPGMVDELKKVLKEIGVSESKIHSEEFSGY